MTPFVKLTKKRKDNKKKNVSNPEREMTKLVRKYLAPAGILSKLSKMHPRTLLVVITAWYAIFRCIRL